jgi:signal transduction histidine kinase
LKIPVLRSAFAVESQDHSVPPVTLAKISSIAAVAVAIGGAIALSSWWSNKPSSHSFLALRPDVALTFIFAGLSLRFFQRPGFSFNLGKVCAFIVAAAGFLSWLQHLTHWRVSLNELFQFLPRGREPTSEQMSLAIGLNFFLIGCALLLFERKSPDGNRPAHLIVLIAFTISGIALVGFIYHVKALYGREDYHYLALYIPLLFIVLGIGILCATPDGWLMDVAIGGGIGSAVFRRLLPPLIVFLVFLSWLRLIGFRQGLYEDNVGTAITVIVHILIFAALVFGIAYSLNRSDLNRQILERRIHERTVMLESANRELEAFAYSVAHDLRAPLRAIDGLSLATLEDYGDKLDADGKSSLERIRDNAHRMNQLINGLLELSRMSRAEINPGQIDLSEIARQILTELQHRDSERQAEVQIEEGLRAKGDPSLIHAAIENLLSNAWKFTARQSKAKIEFRRQFERAQPVFLVRDNGIGFDMNYANKLFGPFQRLHTQAEFAGHGIGLATVQRILHRHGGRIWAESKVNQGTTFYFTLPT